ncbi:putative magnesium transporter NIPA9 [Camellia lanceoleosa]|uniref:Magnesium transporter NIPA9 n=1 Tax=Camellia lanceoleosa TaxID=1840588 RepID=A0ACC0FDP4_9ERIC|nr:putative magnesium transporter NIPA9 [Camellia lanceoleosa]
MTTRGASHLELEHEKEQNLRMANLIGFIIDPKLESREVVMFNWTRGLKHGRAIVVSTCAAIASIVTGVLAGAIPSHRRVKNPWRSIIMGTGVGLSLNARPFSSGGFCCCSVGCYTDCRLCKLEFC